ncbi:MAG: hypothetical protein IT381_02790 [Deltaproteobacteria bacterium]|nr:hypothetical protein [Deltaproteobacteria bacterium]
MAALPASGGAGEAAVLATLDPTELEATLRRVFDHSLALAKSFGRHHGVVLEQPDLVSLLPALGLACGEREHRDGDASCWLERAPCSEASKALCAFYREAIDGLVLGLTDGEVFFRRHRSGGNGDARCLDVLFAAAAGAEQQKYGPIPEAMREGLLAAEQSLARLPGITVRFVGFSEGVLSYVVDTVSTDVAAGAAVDKAVKRRFAGLETRNLAPRSVLAAEP